jgi:hypothetical protein
MYLKFNTKNDSGVYYTVTKDNYGFILTKFTPAVKEGAKKSHSQTNLFYPNLKQIADRLVHENVEGENLDDIINSLAATSENIAKTLTKENV